MLSFLPILSRAKRRLAPGPALLERATEVVELEPGSTFECAPAIHLPGELERVRAYEGNAEAQILRLTQRQRIEAPTLSYLFPEALVADFTVFARGSYEVYRSGPKRPVLSGRPDRFEEAQLCTTSCVESFFGHFLREQLPLEVLAQRREMTPLVFERRPWNHEPGYRTLLGMFPVATSFARVEKLWITDERALNAGWESRYAELRDRVRKKIVASGNRRVFVRRGKLGTGRSLINENEVANDLEANGFRVIAPEDMDARDLVSILSAAECVVCVEGSAQQHALIAMPSGGTFLSIQPPFRFNTIGKVIADRIGVTFAFVVAEPEGDGFKIGSDRILKTLDLVP